MDTQTIINALIALVAFFGGWVIKSMTDSINKIEDRLQAPMTLQH